MAAIRERAEHEGVTDGNGDTNRRRLRRLINTVFFKARTMELAWKYLTGNRKTDTVNHNYVARNIGAFEKLDREGPKVLRYHCAVLLDSETLRNGRNAKTEEITRAVRNHLGIEGAMWRTFTKVGMAGYDDNVRESTLLSLKAITDANCPDAGTELRRNVAAMVHRHQHFQNAQWNQGNAWEAWIRLLNAYFKFSRELATGQWINGVHQTTIANSLNGVADALEWHIANQLPWNATDIDGYMSRAARWHEAMWEQRAREREEDLAQKTWDSLVPPTNVNDCEALPITDGINLTRLGTQMRNCLGTLVDDCLGGHKRVFVISDPAGGPSAAGELRYDGQRWLEGQLETPDRQTGSPAQKGALETLGQMYQKAQTQLQKS